MTLKYGLKLLCPSGNKDHIVILLDAPSLPAGLPFTTWPYCLACRKYVGHTDSDKALAERLNEAMA